MTMVAGKFFVLSVVLSIANLTVADLPPRGICAHRGDRSACPENTVPAFVSAARKGAAMVEFDVKRCKSGELVILHDATVDRTTDGTGRIEEMTFAELRKLDAGVRFGRSFAGTRIPTFDEAIDCLPKDGIWINVHCGGGKGVSAEVARKIREKGRLTQAFVASDRGGVRAARKAVPEIKACRMGGRWDGLWTAQESHEFLKSATDLGYQFAQPHFSVFAAEDAKAFHDKGGKITYFWVNRPDQLAAALAMGVDFPLTDRLDEMLAAFRRWERNPPKTVAAFSPDLVYRGDTAGDRPFVTMRMTGGPLFLPEKMDAVIAVNRRYPGSCDEYWFAHGAGATFAECRKTFEGYLRFVKPCQEAGIAVGTQQGVTLGHGSIHDHAGEVRPAELHAFSDDAWQVDASGKRLEMFCPRSPEVLKYEEDYVELLCKTLNPVSLWLDDDLRMGGLYKADACYCERCLAAFNRTQPKALSRADLVKRLRTGGGKDPVRRAWTDFSAESIALYGAAARRGADKAKSDLLIGYQSVDSSLIKSGRDYLPLLRAMAGDRGLRSAIRVGSGCYDERLGEMTEKVLNVAREAERCRREGDLLAAVSYEQENYCREILHKSAEAAMTESSLALAAGCDALTEYRWDGDRDEPLADYAEFAALLSAWRPHLETQAEISRRTHLGGLARFVGSDYDLTMRYSVADPLDLTLAAMGVPVTVRESGTRIRYVDALTVEEWGEGDGERLFADGAVALVDDAIWDRFAKLAGEAGAAALREGRVARFDFGTLRPKKPYLPTSAEREALLEALDGLKGVRMPVRMDRTHRFYVYPRVDAAERTVAVTVFNGSVGKAPPSVMRVRHPAGARAVWKRPMQPDMMAYAEPGNGDELLVHLPELPGRQAGLLVLTDALPPDFGETASVRDETAVLPVFAPGKWAWTAGYRPRETRLWETSAKDAVLPDSVEVVAADGRKLVRDVDFVVEKDYGTVALTGETAKAAAAVNPVKLSYAYRLERLDACVRTAEGNVDMRRGVPSVAHPRPPELRPGETSLGNFWIRGGGRLDDGAFFPNDGTPVPMTDAGDSETRIPKTLAKLRAGKPVKILAWGDSVTECTYLPDDEKWQELFAERLRAAYPKSEITLTSNGWGAHTLREFLEASAGSPHEYAKTVLGEKPDLVVTEFVGIRKCNKYSDFKALYGKVLADFRKAGIEWILLTPHYEAPDWMSLKSVVRSWNDPRNYVNFLRWFAAENGIALVDVSCRWGHLCKEGLPFPTLLANGCNHPDRRGMEIYASALTEYCTAPSASVTYYVDSAEGCDANPGTSEKMPWKTVGRVNAARLRPGDTVKFRCGRIWRGETLLPRSGLPGRPVTYTRYGTGPKPVFQQSVEYSRPTDWIEVKPGLWMTRPDGPIGRDVGIVVLDHGAKWGFKKWNNPDWDLPSDPKWRKTVGLENDLDYWYDPAGKRVVMRSRGNPGERFKSVELGLTAHIINENDGHDIVYDGLWLRYGAAHGIAGWHTENIVIRNCDFCWIGGGLQSWNRDKTTGAFVRPARYGNGIEFWDDCKNNLVERNRLWEIYDAALTNQGVEGTETDLIWRDNVIWNSEYSYEYWNGKKTSNILFEHNTCVDAGCGWGHAQRSDVNGAHLMYYWNYAATTNFVVRENVFCRATEWTVRMGTDWRRGQLHARNLVWNEDGVPVLNWLRGERFRLCDWKGYQELGFDGQGLFARPVFADADKRDYRLAAGSPGAKLAEDGGPVGVRWRLD